MEFCGVFYETGYLRAVYDRIRKLFFVFLMAAVLTVGMMGQGMETINFGSVRLKDMAGRAVAEYAAGVGTTGSFMISVTEIQISADVSADLFTVPAVISERSEDLNTGNMNLIIKGKHKKTLIFPVFSGNSVFYSDSCLVVIWIL